MAALLQRELEPSELSRLPKNILGKIEKIVLDLHNEIDSLKAQQEQCRVDNEQRFFEKVQQLSQCQDEFLAKSKEHLKLKELNTKLEEEVQAVRKVNREHELTHGRLSSEQVLLSTAKEELEAEKRDLVRTLERRSLEVEHLNDDVRQLNDKLVEAGTSRITLQMKVDELEAAEVNLKYKEKRVEQERELLQGQISWLNEELKAKSDQLLSLSRLKGNDILELKCCLDNKEDELNRLQDQMACCKTSNEHLQKQNEEMTNKLKEAKVQKAAGEERFRNELNANIKLANLYKGAAADAEAKSEELSQAMEELHELLKDAGEANKALEDKIQKTNADTEKSAAELKERIQSLEKELDNANELLASLNLRAPAGTPSLVEEHLTSISPTAAAISKIKPKMKLTELYTAYAESQEQLQLERLENKRVNKYLDDMLQEVEAKGPILKRERDERERMQKSVASLSVQLEHANKEVHRLQTEADEANKLASVLERDRQRSEMQLADMAQQMSVQEYELLKEEDEGCMKKYRRRCMQEMHEKLSIGPRFVGVHDLESGEAFLEVIEKEHHTTVVVVHIYKQGIKSCEDLNHCLDCLATEYPTVKFCRIDAAASGAAERFSDGVLPTLLAYKAGELIGNFLACMQHLNQEFFATDVEAFLNSYGLLPEKDLPTLEDEEENEVE